MWIFARIVATNRNSKRPKETIVDPATDCTTHPEQSRRVDKTDQTAPKVNVIHKSTEPPPILYPVGDLAEAAGCKVFAVQHFLRKKNIRHTGWEGNKRLFSRDVLDQLIRYRDNLSKQKRA